MSSTSYSAHAFYELFLKADDKKYAVVVKDKTYRVCDIEKSLGFMFNKSYHMVAMEACGGVSYNAHPIGDEYETIHLKGDDMLDVYGPEHEKCKAAYERYDGRYEV